MGKVRLFGSEANVGNSRENHVKYLENFGVTTEGIESDLCGWYW